jgi:hypothetical protein
VVVPRPITNKDRPLGGIIDALETIGVTYAIWGGMAVVAYGEPRFTQGMDILLHPDPFAVFLFVRRLQEAHYHVDEIAVNRDMNGGISMSCTWVIISRQIFMSRLKQN